MDELHHLYVWMWCPNECLSSSTLFVCFAFNLVYESIFVSPYFWEKGQVNSWFPVYFKPYKKPLLLFLEWYWFLVAFGSRNLKILCISFFLYCIEFCIIYTPCVLTNTSWGWGHMAVILVLQVVMRGLRERTTFFPRYIKNPQSFLWRKLCLLHYSTLGVKHVILFPSRHINNSGLSNKTTLELWNLQKVHLWYAKEICRMKRPINNGYMLSAIGKTKFLGLLLVFVCVCVYVCVKMGSMQGMLVWWPSLPLHVVIRKSFT
jgi:hypothetical protein